MILVCLSRVEDDSRHVTVIIRALPFRLVRTGFGMAFQRRGSGELGVAFCALVRSGMPVAFVLDTFFGGGKLEAVTAVVRTGVLEVLCHVGRGEDKVSRGREDALAGGNAVDGSCSKKID
jgi:hypothetical protein